MERMDNIFFLEQEHLPENCYVFKHSTRCPVSTTAAENIKQITRDIPLFWINVMEQRSLSNWIERTYKVKHESPQLLLVENNAVVKVWNHQEIKKDTIKTSG